ncbi:MAG: diacylglycerol kinase [Mailhella sp.]|nr:diacylglycerol kinase [Mailhella sp.]
MNREKLREGFFHVFKAAGYSLAGLRTGLRLSLAFRQEAAILAVLIVMLAAFGKPFTTWLAALGAWFLVMAAELLNTALEETLNLITRDYNIAVKHAKDMASAAVFLMLALNAGLWFAIFVLKSF